MFWRKKPVPRFVHLVMFMNDERTPERQYEAIISPASVDSEGQPDLDLLRAMISCRYVQRFICEGGIVGWCDEDGGMTRRPFSVVVERGGGHTGLLRGPVVFVVENPTSPEDSIARVLRIAAPLPASQSKDSGRREPTPQ